uniref:Uncharacterized protein n=1 Tax=Anguilla anguilla TaxID=7936 RepID=A0A0E9RQK0_ANGAN
MPPSFLIHHLFPVLASHQPCNYVPFTGDK